MTIRRIVPDADELAAEELVETITGLEPMEPFAPLTLELLDTFAERLRETAPPETAPIVTSLAFWLRESNIAEIRDRYRNRRDSREISVPLGYVFHVAPANIDPMFIYSWALSLLAGNTNIVRVSSRRSRLMSHLLETLGRCLSDSRFAPLARRNAFVTFPHESDTAGVLSAPASGRLIWGDDSTVSELRRLPCAPDARTLTFPDRHSAAVVSTEAIGEADDSTLENLADRFTTDAYLFDQRACASPQFVFFAGDGDPEAASRRFWDAVAEQLRADDLTDPPGLAATKLRHLHQLVADGLDVAERPDLDANSPTVVRVSEPRAANYRSCGGGFFFETFLPGLDHLEEWLRPTHQTLTHWGFERDSLTPLVRRLRGRSLQRVVPVGRALEFEPIWDGWDLLADLTRTIPVRT